MYLLSVDVTMVKSLRPSHTGRCLRPIVVRRLVPMKGWRTANSPQAPIVLQPWVKRRARFWSLRRARLGATGVSHS